MLDVDALLMEALFRANRLLDGEDRYVSGGLDVRSSQHFLDIFIGTATALTFWKGFPERGASLKTMQTRCNWNLPKLEKALTYIRELMVLDDLANT